MSDDDRVRIGHMIEAAEEIERFISGRQRSDMDSDRMLRFAVVRAIEIIGEAASQVSETTRVKAREVPWPAIVVMRHRIVHAYWDTDAGIIWKTAAEEVPALLPTLRALLEDRGNG
jgi:uncharacterized protein with HEPN domain